MEIKAGRAKKTADTRAEAPKNLEELYATQTDALKASKAKEAAVLLELCQITEIIVTQYPKATDQALGRIPETDPDRDLHPGELVGVINEEANQLRAATLKVFDYVWPEAAPPATIDDLAKHLWGAPELKNMAREWAAHGGIEMVLTLLKSWYLDVDLWSLSHGFRQGSNYDQLHADVPDIRSCAVTIGSNVVLDRDFSDLAGTERYFHSPDAARTDAPAAPQTASTDVASYSRAPADASGPSAP